jgi:hypothetical protein
MRPLDSPNWTPLTEVHRFVCEQTGDRRLAARDLTDAMANDRVRSMRRQVERFYDDEPERELLPPSFWATEYRLEGWFDELLGRRTQGSPRAAAATSQHTRAGAVEVWTASTDFARLCVLRLETGLQKIFWSACPAGGHKGVSARKARKIRASPDYAVARTARGNRAALLAKGPIYCTGKPYDTDHGIAGMAQKKVQKRT